MLVRVHGCDSSFVFAHNMALFDQIRVFAGQSGANPVIRWEKCGCRPIGRYLWVSGIRKINSTAKLSLEILSTGGASHCRKGFFSSHYKHDPER
jgi:hypothetical protein